MMIEYVTLDSSFLVSVFANQEFGFQISKNFMNYALKNQVELLVPMTVLLESFHTLQRKGVLGRDENNDKFQIFMNHRLFQYFDLNMSFFNMFRELPFFNKLKTSDAIIAASAFINKSILISWDKRLLENSWQGYTPEEFLKKFA